MDDELEGCIADARIATSAAHDHLTRIEERARKVRAEIETTVRAAVQWEMRERIATAESQRDEAFAEVRRLRAEVAKARREGAAAMRTEGIEACERVRKNSAERLAEAKGDILAGTARAVLRGACEAADMCGNAIRALPLDAGGES